MRNGNKRVQSDAKWWLKFMILGITFGLGSWFGHGLARLHYEKLLAESSELHADECRDQVAGLLDMITIKFCAAWNVTVPPYDEDVDKILKEKKK